MDGPASGIAGPASRCPMQGADAPHPGNRPLQATTIGLGLATSRFQGHGVDARATVVVTTGRRRDAGRGLLAILRGRHGGRRHGSCLGPGDRPARAHRHPARFARTPPEAPALPVAVRINPPAEPEVSRGPLLSSRCSAGERPSRRPGLPPPTPARERAGTVLPEGPAPRGGTEGPCATRARRHPARRRTRRPARGRLRSRRLPERERQTPAVSCALTRTVRRTGRARWVPAVPPPPKGDRPQLTDPMAFACDQAVVAISDTTLGVRWRCSLSSVIRNWIFRQDDVINVDFYAAWARTLDVPCASAPNTNRRSTGPGKAASSAS